MATEKDNPFNKGVPSGFSSYNSIHDHADTDETHNAIHHTLGKGATQAAPGKDTDDRFNTMSDRIKVFEDRQHGSKVVAVGTTQITETIVFNPPFKEAPFVMCTIIDVAAPNNLAAVRWGSDTNDSSGVGNLNNFIFKAQRPLGNGNLRINWEAIPNG